MRFDHVVVLVPDLARAVADYTALGFTVAQGGEHRGGATRNALIGFSDGTYIELLAATRRLAARTIPILGKLGLSRLVGHGKTPLEQRLRTRLLKGFGLVDFAVLSELLDADLTRLRREGIRAEGPLEGGRITPAGEEIAWRLAVPLPRELPFLCCDTTDRALRIPGAEFTEHANGARGIASLTVAVHSVETSSARYRALLGVEPDPGARERMRDARGRIFNLNGIEVVLASSTAASSPIRRHLRERGEGPFELALRGDGERRMNPLDPARTQGFRLSTAGTATAAVR